ncbi:unnamed protein product, partial [Hapterophycus canaliculatus]
GDVVHVLFPVSPRRGGDGDGGDPLSVRTGTGPGQEEEEEMEDRVLASPHVVVDNASGRLLVVQPDILVSPTKVADTVLCTRKAVLQSRLTSDASKSKPAVMGNLKHELFETSLLAAAAAAAAKAAKSGSEGALDGTGGGPLTSHYMARLVDRIVLSQLEALYGAGLDEDTARRELLSVTEPILDWHRSFLARGGAHGRRNPQHPPQSANQQRRGGGGGRGGAKSSAVGTGGRRSGSSPARSASSGAGGEGGLASLTSHGEKAARVTVFRVLATEDDVWSPVLGLKGIMDATVEAEVQPLIAAAFGGGGGRGGGGGDGERSPERSSASLVMPLEVKTGKRIGEANSSHRAQVTFF